MASTITMHNTLWLRSPTSSIAPDSPNRLNNTSDCVNITNLLLTPFSKIGQQEQSCVAALLEAIVHKVAAPHSRSLAQRHIDVAYNCPTQLLAIAVYVGIDVSDTGFVNAKGRASDIAELFRRIVIVCARSARDVALCLESRDRGLAYVRQDRRWLRRAHRGYRIYHKYGVRLETQFRGEWFDQGEDMYEVGLDMWEQQGEAKGGWMKRMVASLT